MSSFQLQESKLHTILEATRYYIEMLEEDFGKAHQEHRPIITIFNQR